jgi:uncharacterized protein YuzE
MRDLITTIWYNYCEVSTTTLARTLQLNQESFIAIDNNGKAITSNEIVRQTGLILPKQLEKFLFSDYMKKT